MPAPIGNTDTILDKDAYTIVLRRVFAAPRELVFEAWTQPEHVACWWDPSGEPLAECEIDLRPGGAFRFVNRNPPGSHRFAGVYREIAPPNHFTFEAMGSIGRVDLDETGDKTLLTMRIECGSAERFEQYLKMGIDTGTAQTLDNLVLYVGAVAQRKSGARSGAPGKGG